MASQRRSTAISPDPRRPKRTVSVPPVVRIESVSEIIRPLRSTARGRVPQPAASAARTRIASVRVMAGRDQIRPRPAFLMRPSAVSDSTILSSTPLMKVLLPGVE